MRNGKAACRWVVVPMVKQRTMRGKCGERRKNRQKNKHDDHVKGDQKNEDHR